MDQYVTRRELREELAKFDPLVSMVNIVINGLVRVEHDVRVLKTDVNELKSDVRELKSDVKELKTDVAGIKTELKSMKTELSDELARHSQANLEAMQKMFAALDDKYGGGPRRGKKLKN